MIFQQNKRKIDFKSEEFIPLRFSLVGLRPAHLCEAFTRCIVFSHISLRMSVLVMFSQRNDNKANSEVF